jgi:hypothetical protein
LQEWIDQVNKEVIQANPPTLTLTELLKKAFAIKKAKTKASSSGHSKKKQKKTG